MPRLYGQCLFIVDVLVMATRKTCPSLLDFCKSKWRAIAMLILPSMLAGCTTMPPAEKSAWPNEAISPHVLYLQSKHYPALYVEVDAVEGTEPTDESLKKLGDFLRQYCDKPDGITIKRSSVIPRKAARGYSADSLAAGYMEGPPTQTNGAAAAFLYVLYYDNRLNKNVVRSPREAGQRPLKHPLPSDMSRRENPHVNFLQYPAMIYIDASYGPDVWEPKEFPELCLLHEAGHTLGLVSREGRVKTAHCTNSVCLMQPTFKMRYYVIPWLKSKRPKAALCAGCEGELKQRRSVTTTNQVRFVGPVLVRTMPSYSVFSLPGCHALCAGDSIDEHVEAFLKEFKERFANSNGKMERWFRYDVQFDEALPTVVQAALEDPSPDIRYLARHMQKAHNVKLPERDPANSVASESEHKTD